MQDEWLENLVIDDPQLGDFRVDRRAFTDPRILELEQERVFDQCWIYAGHETEVPAPGDFVARNIAGRPLILVRGSHGRLRIFLNTCRHRGAPVCRAREGNTQIFQCPYHGWTYDNDGRLIAVPGRDGYGASFDCAQLGLLPVPRLDVYRGFVFVSFNPASDELTEYLAGAREYLDLVCDQSEAGLEVIRATYPHSMRANWKLLAENGVDQYQRPVVDERPFGDPGGSRAAFRRSGVGKALGNGHAVIEMTPSWAGSPLASWSPIFPDASKERREARRRRLVARLGSERAFRIMQTHRSLLIFPSVVINDVDSITVQTFFPLRHDYVEVGVSVLGPSDEVPEERALRMDSLLSFLGPGGYATAEDVEILESCQRSFACREARWSDLSRGMMREQPRHDEELQNRTFWRRWHELMMLHQVKHIATA